RFLADQIIALNRINPQVASRMSGAFTQWRRFDASRQKLIRQELQRIMSAPDICTDVYEVVSKSLS
ncbi:MAG: aminopeptidase N C-terminal domain-containing protein, partial [Gammaproteobacteria bacterium]